MGARHFLNKKNFIGSPDMDLLRRRSLDLKQERQQSIVTQTVQEAGGDLNKYEVSSLARALHRSPAVIKGMVEEARAQLASKAVDYVNYHESAVTQALANGDPKALEVAARASQWALEHISFDGKRVVEKTANEAGSGTKILIGIKLGGQNPDQPVAVEAVDAETTES